MHSPKRGVLWESGRENGVEFNIEKDGPDLFCSSPIRSDDIDKARKGPELTR
jgi:hypothetical protein